MRTASSAQAALNLALHRRETPRLWIEDATETMVDRTEWLVEGAVGDSFDEFCLSGDITLHRVRQGDSLAPKVDDTNRVAVGRRLRLEVALSDLGTVPDEDDYVVLGNLVIDRIAFGGAGSNTMTLQCRDEIGAAVHDTYIRFPSDRPAGAQSVVIQALLDDEMEAGAAPTLVTLEADDITFSAYRQRRQHLSEAVRARADANGRVIKPRWNEVAGAFRLTLYSPDRVQQSQDYGFNASNLFDIPAADLDGIGVRSEVIVEYDDGGDTVTAVATNEDLIADPAVGRKTAIMDFRGTGIITSTAQAQNLAELILLDLSQPLYTQGADHGLFWRVELGDYYQYLDDGTVSGEVTTLAVTRYEHRIVADPNTPSTTTIYGRGKPSGGRYRWEEYDRVRRDRDELGVGDPPTPSPAAPSTVGLYLTTVSGEAGFSLASTPGASLGGYVSTTPASSGLFRAITASEGDDGITLYRTIAIVNSSYEETHEGLRVWVSTEPEVLALAIALDPEGVVDLEQAGKQGGESADEETAPTPLSGSITYSAPTEIGSGLSIGTLPPRSVVLLHERVVVSSSTAFADTTASVRVSVCLPSEAES